MLFSVHMERQRKQEGWATEYNVEDAKSRHSGGMRGRSEGGTCLHESEVRWARMAFGSAEAYWWKGIDEASVCSMKPPAHYRNPRTAKQLDASPRHMSACHAPLTALCASYPTLQIRRKVNRIYRLLSVSPIASASRLALVTGACVCVLERERERDQYSITLQDLVSHAVSDLDSNRCLRVLICGGWCLDCRKVCAIDEREMLQRVNNRLDRIHWPILLPFF